MRISTQNEVAVKWFLFGRHGPKNKNYSTATQLGTRGYEGYGMLSDSVFELRTALFHAGHNGIAQLGHARGIHLGHALELIGNAQLLVLDDTHRVIRQHFQAHHVVPWSDEATELLALLHRVGNARHHHVADQRP